MHGDHEGIFYNVRDIACCENFENEVEEIDNEIKGLVMLNSRGKVVNLLSTRPLIIRMIRKMFHDTLPLALVESKLTTLPLEFSLN